MHIFMTLQKEGRNLGVVCVIKIIILDLAHQCFIHMLRSYIHFLSINNDWAIFTTQRDIWTGKSPFVMFEVVGCLSEFG